VSAEHLMGLLRQKTVTSATLVWKEGMGNWLALAEAGLGAPTVSAAGDLGNAFKRFLTDPVGGLPELCEALGGRRALLLGICFCLICDFCLMLSGFLWFLMYASNHDPFDNQLFIHFNLLWEMARSHKMAFLLKLLVLAFLPLFSLAGAISCVRAVTSGRGQFGYDLLISGTAILPIGLFCPIAVLLGPLNFEVILFAYVLIFCLMILFLNCGFTRIVGLSDRGAILAVPATLIIMFWLVKVIVTSEFLNTFGG